ncbi:myomesin-1-like isoform X1 [Acipenser ruthenus]|uniref:myomesin-1-like isoform X1 n=2 Tax=Acipenser ruthenus TaxID=7906 RepID=UPI00274116FD|nr:myomesin-1-like isoform X1 [Acipenser ruthenus]XP_058878508.1 myomesin-1-like isoform X1 [Acipenser ruthenus]
MSLPLYQKQHKHYDRGYRSTEVQSALSQYHLEEKSSTESHSKGSRAALYSDEVLVESSSKLSPRPKRPRPTYTALDHEIIGYVVPVFRGRREYVSGITDTEEERIKETAGYLARRNLFSSGEGVTAISRSTEDTVREEMFEKKSRKTAMRESAERINLNKKIHETVEFHRKQNEDSLLHAPEFVIKPRSHTVWEKQNVKLHCTVTGWPEPRVTWYKNNVPIDVHAYPGKYKIESKYSVHSLEINRCDFEDTAQYRASAMNIKGELSALSSVVVKRYKGEIDTSSFSTVSEPLSYGLSTSDYGTKFDIHIVEKFAVSFGREGETMSLGCTVIVYPNMKRIQPEIQWYRDGVLLQPSKWMQMHWSGERATLTLTHLNKEDEGLYTMRVVTKSGYETYSAYVFVRDAEAEVAGAPAAPLDVECLDANKDYVIVTWKQPAVNGGSPILGYFVDRCEVGTTHWSQCNDTPVKFARFPVTGLVEGRSYIFRVRAVNKNGISRPSRVSNPIAAMDPADKARMKGHPSAPWTGQIIVTEEEPAEGVVPGKPCQLAVTEATKSYVVLSWKPPGQRGHEGIMYYVEKCVAGTDSWQRVNTEIPVKSPRFALFDLAEGKSYCFRVRCCNSAGVGEPSEPTEATVVGDKLDIPKPPGHVLPTRNTDTCVVLTWAESKDAKDLVGYYIEATVVGSGVWEPCNNKPVKGTRFFCHGLSTGQTYVFRVSAVNAAGLSEFSQESEAIEVKAAIGGGVPHGVCPETSGKTGELTERSSRWEGKHEASQPAPDTLLKRDAQVNRDMPPISSESLAPSPKVSKDNEAIKGSLPAAPIASKKVDVEQTSKSELEGSSKKEKMKQWKDSASPAPPYGISVLETVRNSMVLGWKQPKFIGGAEITGYFVDYREVIDGVVGKWHEAHIKPVSERAYRVNDLKENMTYQFQVRAANIAGVGIPSLPSTSFKCEEWTIAVPGPPYDLRCTEVRKDSLVLLWNPPVYSGRSEVNGFYLDIKEAEADESQWRSVNEKATQKKYMKIKHLKEGNTYVFRVRAQNKAGVGKPSDETEPVLAETRPGTKEVVVDVDDDGVISLIYECSEMTADSKFVWSKNYEEVSDSSRLAMETKGGRSRAVFKDPAIEDVGIYSCVVTETDGVSASYTLDEDELKRLLEMSHDHKFPTVPLKSDLAVELLEKGRVRFWLQAEKLSANAKSNFVFNDTDVIHGEKYKMSVDKNTGIIEMIMEKLEDEDEGTFTFQLKDGKAANQSSLVLIGDVFKKLQKESEFQRQEWFRKQGPHFVEYLGWEVTPKCDVLLKCKVANILKETTIIWYKDEREIMFDDKHDFKEGVCTLLISQISKKDAGIYEVILRDDRGKDKSLLKLVDQGFTDVMNGVFKVIAESATELKIQSTEEGIRLYSFVTYYNEELRVSWHHKESKISYTERVKCGVTGEQLWLQINEPTEKDKGKYAMEIFDGKGGLQKAVDVSGQAFEDAYAEFQRLKQAAIAERNRARVVGGLPDVVTIQEGKSLNLTCNVWGDPVPEVTWLKNEREMVGDDHCILKFASGKFASFTITSVSSVDSGKYSILVKNKYGTETGDFTVSVFTPDGEEEKAAPEAKKEARKK